MSLFKDAGHLFRFAGSLFSHSRVPGVRHFVVPQALASTVTIGAAIAESLLTGEVCRHDTCEGCHSDVADKKNKASMRM